MSDPSVVVLDLARREGLPCDGVQPLRSTNNAVFLVTPCAVVAKVHGSERIATRELAAGLALARLGAPVVPPAAGIGDEVRSDGDLHVTFWTYVPDGSRVTPASGAVAVALCALHRHLAGRTDMAGDRTFEEHSHDAMRALDRPTFAPRLGRSDRRLLQQTLARAVDDLRGATRAVVHGSPHRMNILSMRGSPVFIDLETIQLGPIEWDLAHLEPAVADRYPEPVDDDLLATCRTAVSATTATWCWDALERGPDMRRHAEHHLALVRACAS